METMYFTGFSGTGKTMIGKMLASRKDLKFLDTDAACEKKENKEITEIFREKGEDYFRDIESYILKNEVKQGMIVSLGGGTIISEDNRHFIKRTGRVIYLRAKATTIFESLEKDHDKRPLLKDNFSVFTIDKLLEERRPMYEELANYVIDVDNKTVSSVFKEALAIYNFANKVKCHILIK